MKRSIFALAAVAALGAAGAASAQTTTGTISSIDPATRMVTLQNGSQYQFGPDYSFDTLRAGDKVRIEYALAGTRKEAQALQPIG